MGTMAVVINPELGVVRIMIGPIDPFKDAEEYQ
jgi:hypothetical protein